VRPGWLTWSIWQVGEQTEVYGRWVNRQTDKHGWMDGWMDGRLGVYGRWVNRQTDKH